MGEGDQFGGCGGTDGGIGVMFWSRGCTGRRQIEVPQLCGGCTGPGEDHSVVVSDGNGGRVEVNGAASVAELSHGYERGVS